MSEPATTPSVPEGHPAHILLDEEHHDFPHIEIEVTSGIRPEEMQGLRRWWATATVTDHAKPPLHIPVAHMNLTLVNEFLCDPVYALDAIDHDSLVLAEALWSGDERRPEFEELVPDNWCPTTGDRSPS